MTMPMKACLLILALAAPAAPTLAQDITTGTLRWKPVHQAHADIDPLSMRLRDMRVDLRSPENFDREYQLQGRPSFFGSSTYYMRRNGALTAIYQHPQYTPTGHGIERVDIP